MRPTIFIEVNMAEHTHVGRVIGHSLDLPLASRPVSIFKLFKCGIVITDMWITILSNANEAYLPTFEVLSTV